MGYENDGWGRSGRDDHYNRRPQQPPPYAAIGNYAEMGRQQSYHHQHQGHHDPSSRDAARSHDHYGSGGRDYHSERNNDFRRQDSGGGTHLQQRASTKSRPPCKFFAKGYCFKGSDCPFRHEESPSKRPEESRNNHVASHHYGRADSNRSVGSEKPDDDFGRRKPPPEQLGSHQNSNEMQSHHYGRADSNRSVSSNKSNVDEFGRKQSSSEKGGHRNRDEMQSHHYGRADSNISVSSDKSGVDIFGRKKAPPEQEGNGQASSESFWSKVASDKPLSKTLKKQTVNNDVPEPTAKKTIKWGLDSTHSIHEKNFCRLPGHDHLWSECPENPYSKKKKKGDAPALTAEESRAMMRAALNASSESAADPTATSAAKPDYYANVATNSDSTPKPLATPNSQAISINSLNSTIGLKNNQLKRPPTVTASNAGTGVAHSMGGPATASHKPTMSSISGVAIPRRNSTDPPVPRRPTELVRRQSSETSKRNSLLIDTSASKLTSAAKTPTPQSVQQQKFMSRSQRAMAKRPSPDEQTPANKKRKVLPKPKALTSPMGRQRMECKKGHWRQVSVPVAPLGKDAIPITKHTNTRLLKKQANPFDSQDAEDEEDASENQFHDSGTNLDFCESDAGEENVEENHTQNAPTQLPGSKSNSMDRMKSPDVICLDSTDEDENDATENEQLAPTTSDNFPNMEEEKYDGSHDDADDEHGHEQMQDSSSDVEEENDQNIPAFTDAQIDEMEADLLDFAEFCNNCSTYNSASLRNALTNEESTVSGESSCEDTDDEYQFDNVVDDDDNLLTNRSTKHTRNAPQDSSSSSSSGDPRENVRTSGGSSHVLSVNTKLKPTHQSGSTSSVTPSPEGTIPSNRSTQNDPSDSNFPAFVTCDKCQLVFTGCRVRRVINHERTCNSESGPGRVFYNALDLCLYLNEIECHKGSQSELPCYFYPPGVRSSRSASELNYNGNKSPSAHTNNANTKTWDLKYEAVEDFYNTHGHLDLPNKKSDRLGNLYAWLAQQKCKFRGGTLSKGRAKKLKKLDRDFAAKVDNSNEEPKSSNASSKSKKKLKPWDMRYEAVKKFHAENGHFNLPNEETPELGNLLEWLTQQKNKLRYGTLSEKHIPKLNKLFVLSSDVEHPKESIEEDEILMPTVEHLCYTDLSSGLPRQSIVILDTLTDTLHYFQTEIRESTIVSGGRGAFLTYLGAKVLNAESHARSERLIKGHELAENTFHHPMAAVTENGKRMSVTVAPNSLLPNENNPLWSKARSKAYDKHRKKYPDSLFDENSVKCSVHSEVQSLKSQIPKDKRIGLLGINSISDYVNDDSVSFWSSNLFELGRYGPFRPEDIYSESLFNFKNFLFDYEPHEWAYSLGHETTEMEIIDITDGSTGQIHNIAKQHTSIYVNEVGHSNDLHENVLIREKGESSVYYYVSIDEEHAMKKGDTVELLVNYGDHYEPVRERKGYGRVNIEQDVGGDDEDKSRLQRNFVERREMESEIVDLSFEKLCEVALFIHDRIYQPILEAMQKPGVIKSRHIIALRRLSWLAERFLRRLNYLRTSAATLRRWFHEWNFTSDNIKKMNINICDTTDNGKSVRRVINDEVSEELLYAKPLLPYPMDESIWSKVAIDLTRHCVSCISTYMFGTSVSKAEMLKHLLDGVMRSANAVRKAARLINNPQDISATQLELSISLLAFKTCHKQLYFDTSNAIGIYDSTTAKSYGEATSLAELQAYHDAVDLCSIETSYACPGMLSRTQDNNLVLISKYHSDNTDQIDIVNAPQFRWMPRTVDAFRKGNARIHEKWYLYNQILLVAHLLADIVDWNFDTTTDDDSPMYSLNKICFAIGLDAGVADAAISRGAFNPIPASSERKKCMSPTKARRIVHTTTSQMKRVEYKPKKSKSELKTPKCKAGKSVKKATLHAKPTGSTKFKTPSPEADDSDPKTNGLALTEKSVDNSSPEERTEYDGPCDRFKGFWYVLRIKRKTGDHIDNYWYHPDYKEIKVRSSMGVKEIMNTMKLEQVDFSTACVQLMNAGKRYFHGCARVLSRLPAS